MQKAIIHTKTQVIRRLTTDVNPQIAPDESIIDLDSPISIGNDFKKLNHKKELVTASPEEIDEAGVDEDRQRIKRAEKYNQLQSVIQSLSQKINEEQLREYFRLLSQ